MIKSLYALLFGVLLSLVLLEILLRIVPNKYTEYNSTVGYANDELVGRLAPNQAAVWNKSCFQIKPVKTNSSGYRDSQRKSPGPVTEFKIAVLGDSYMEALAVGEGDYTSAIMEKITGLKTLNFGISGFGTIHEYLTYKKYVRPLGIKTVLLFFFAGNDVSDNSCDLNQKQGLHLYKSCGRVENGAVKITNIKKRALGSESSASKIKNYLRTYCKICLFFGKIIGDRTFWNNVTRYFSARPKNNISKTSGEKKENKKKKTNIPLGYLVYMPPPDKSWKEAWTITEHFLKKLKEEVEKSGARLIVVNIPEYIRISINGHEELRNYLRTQKLPAGFDPEYPVRRLEKISEKYDIGLLGLKPSFIKYRDTFNLKAPYFSYRCDGHWNPLGHFLAANVVSRYLIKNNLVPVKNKAFVLTEIEENLSRSPKEVLGEKAYQEIYGGGVFKGKTNIPALLN